MNETARNALETVLANTVAARAQAAQRRHEMAIDLASQDASIVVLDSQIVELEAALAGGSS
jgi:hypothetical protein